MAMKQLCGWLLAGACLTNGAAAQPLPLWEIEGANNRVFVLGSVHMLRADDYPLPAPIEAAYAAADQLVMEIDMDALDPVATQQTMTQLAMNGTPLDASMGAKNYAEAKRLAADEGIPLEQFAPFEPWFAALMIAQLRLQQLGFDPAWGIEQQLSQRAPQDGKEITGLETLAGQLGFMDGLDLETQRLFLLETLKADSALQEEMQALMTAWQSGDMQALAKLQQEMIDEAPELYDALFTRRNRNWVPQIVELTQQKQDYLVVVGAMHLAGDGNVIELLEAEGLKARQLSNAN